ncbi:tautomerase family protein [Pseudodonghicola flavimaris]|uniref:Tautomerase family protein n=1 Tax=Pseudodonghicola flavimaris TaxID=3050036 RepID=A0ABT7EWY0_9RHOB|nr:tautomerase family protein [Pseudodonghicola flavimaris]MDK3016849.1 tautomerase family protein [Pseudodonghicola flavimaris]
MAHIEAQFFAKRFEDEEFNEKMITALTEAVASVLGEAAGKDTTIILHSIEPERWGFGGMQLSKR